MEIAFHFQKKIALTDRKRLKQFIPLIFNCEKTAAISLNIIFCDDEYLLEINQSFLQHDYYTDIISFNLSPDPKEAVEGELYISADRVQDNAVEQHVPFKEELHRVIFHGILHLSGFKDKTKKDILTMRQAEDKYLSLYFDKGKELLG
jgi:probable rRNA maturation factor